MDAIETLEHNGYTLAIYPDDCPESPREWDNLGTLALFHRRYNLPNETDYRTDDFSSWDELEDQIRKDHGPCLILPVWAYDHSCFALSTHSWYGRAQHAEWDSGRVGFIFVTYAKIRAEYGYKHLTKDRLAHITRILEGEVDTYSQYINGDVYGYTITDPEIDDVIDSCWGYYGTAEAMAEAIRACPDPILHGEPEI